MKTLPCKIIVLLTMLIASPALAEIPDLTPLNYELRYDVSWNGMTLGRIRVTVHEDAFGYNMLIDTKTKGMASLFSDERSIAQVKGRFDEEFGYTAQTYESRQLGKGGRTTTLTYDTEGKLKNRVRTRDDDPAWRPPVPVAQANSATDPMTAFFRLRQTMHDHFLSNQRDTAIRTYEGARLAEFTFRVISRARVEVNDRYYDAINVVPTRRPIIGYTPKELKKYKKKGDPTVHVYFSADGKFIPLMAEANLAFGSITATLSEIKEIK